MHEAAAVAEHVQESWAPAKQRLAGWKPPFRALKQDIADKADEQRFSRLAGFDHQQPSAATWRRCDDVTNACPAGVSPGRYAIGHMNPGAVRPVRLNNAYVLRRTGRHRRGHDLSKNAVEPSVANPDEHHTEESSTC